MSNSISLTAAKRDELGSTASRRLRKQGFIPAVIYSAGAENINFQLDNEQAAKIEHHAGMVTIAIDGIGTKNAIVKDIQYKAINGQILSLDFLEVKADQKVNVIVPLEAKGEPVGIRNGGQLEQMEHQIEIAVSPADIPEVIIVDVSALEVDQFITLGQITLPASAHVVADANQIAFQVRIPHTKATEEAAPAADAAAAPAEEKK